MPAWQKIALFVFVGSVHAGLLIGFNDNVNGVGPGYPSKPIQVSVTFKGTLIGTDLIQSSTSNRDATKPVVSDPKTTDETSVAPVLTDSVRVPALPLALDGLAWTNRVKFLYSDQVDTTAYLSDGFENALEQRLPLDVESIMLEFWISDDGSTVQVTCLEGVCSDAVISSLGKLSELKFSPAIKDNQAVPSRKVIQIDPRPRFGM